MKNVIVLFFQYLHHSFLNRNRKLQNIYTFMCIVCTGVYYFHYETYDENVRLIFLIVLLSKTVNNIYLQLIFRNSCSFR